MTGLSITEIRHRKQGTVLPTWVCLTGGNSLTDTMTSVPNPSVLFQTKLYFRLISFLKQGAKTWALILLRLKALCEDQQKAKSNYILYISLYFLHILKALTSVVFCW